MTNATKTIADNVPSNPHFVPTREIVVFEGDHGTNCRAVCTASDVAKAWDGASDEVTHTLYSELNGVFCYCKVTVHANSIERFAHGSWGRTARVQFWNDDGFGESHLVFLTVPR